MKSGRGGDRRPAKVGRPATGQKERITIQPTAENLEWLRKLPKTAGGYSAVINALIDAEREKAD